MVAETGAFHNLADKGVAVGMDSRGTQSEENVSGLHGRSIRQDRSGIVASGVDGADSSTNGIVRILDEETWHLGRLTTDEGTASLHTSLRNTGDEGRSRLDVEVTAGVAVQEEKRLRTLDDKIVDVHGNKVDTDSVVDTHDVRDLKLRAHSINSSNYGRGVWVIGWVRSSKREGTSKTTDHCVGTGTTSAGHGGLDAVHQLVTSVDRDTCGGVCEALLGLLFLRISEGTVGNVLAVMHALEVDRGDTDVTLANGLLQGLSSRGSGDDTSTGALQLVANQRRTCVEDHSVLWGRIQSNGASLGVRARISFCDSDDSRSKLGLDFNGDTIQPVFRTSNHDLSEVGILAE